MPDRPNNSTLQLLLSVIKRPRVAGFVALAAVAYKAYDQWGDKEADPTHVTDPAREPVQSADADRAKPGKDTVNRNRVNAQARPAGREPSADDPTPPGDVSDKAAPANKAPAGSTIRLLDWNIENFSGRSLSQAPDRPRSPRGRHHDGPPERGHDLSAMRVILNDHAPDLVTFQEVLEPKRLAEVFPDFNWNWTRHGGRGQQYIALGVRKQSAVTCRALPDLEALSAGKSVRPGLRARCVHPDRPDFEIIAVHLKAGSKGHDLRRDQWKTIFKTLRKSRAPTVVVGDLNFAGAPDNKGPADDEAEREAFTKNARNQAQLLESRLSVPCTAYWEGEDRRDGLLESSMLDGVWLRGFGQDPAPKSQVLGACREKKCKRIPGGRGRKAAAMAGLSDHCPLLVAF